MLTDTPVECAPRSFIASIHVSIGDYLDDKTVFQQFERLFQLLLLKKDSGKHNIKILATMHVYIREKNSIFMILVNQLEQLAV